MHRTICAAFAISAVLAFAQETAAPIQPLLDTASAAHMKGDYEAARQSLLQAWELAQQAPPADPIRYDILKRLVSVRAAAGEFADADNYVQMAINWRETTIGREDPKIADDLLVSVTLARGLKNFDRALFILQRVSAIHRQAYGAESTAVADDYSRMAQVHMEKKNVESAIDMLNAAIAMRTKIAGPLDRSLVPDLDRLATAHITQRTYDKAESVFRQALVIRETLLGKNEADLIATVDGLAYACFGQKKYEEAEPIYQRLIALWTLSVGPDHPMVAIALDKVSVFYADQKKFDQAHQAQNRANAIRAHFLASGLSTAAAAQTAEGQQDEALTNYKRALLVLDPPHELYNEMRTQLEDIVKGIESVASKPVPKKAPPPRKK